MQNPDCGDDLLYSVHETKGTLDLNEPRPDGKREILFARKRFRDTLVSRAGSFFAHPVGSTIYCVEDGATGLDPSEGFGIPRLSIDEAADGLPQLEDPTSPTNADGPGHPFPPSASYQLCQRCTVNRLSCRSLAVPVASGPASTTSRMHVRRACPLGV